MPPRVISTSLDLATDPDTFGQEALFEKVAAEFAAPLARLARAHEADAHQQQDLLQEIHIACGAVSPGSVNDVRCEPGCTVWRITWLPHTCCAVAAARCTV